MNTDGASLAAPARGAFVTACRTGDLLAGEPRRCEVAGEAVCLLLTPHGEVLAFPDSCPHRGHPLSEGRCDGGVLRCALHGWEFSLDDGSAVSPRAPFGLELRDVRVTGNRVEVWS